MKKSVCLLILVLSFSLPQICLAEDAALNTGTIDVEISGLRSSSGEARANLYSSGDGFPSEPKKAVSTLTSRIEGDSARVVFENIRYGEYAISVIHDENGNGKMDMNWIGMPAEGVGASNNPKIFLGPPKFGDARFRLDREDVSLKIKVHY